MKTTTHYPDIEVVELTNEDAAEVLAFEFDPLTSDFGRLEPACPVATMEEQRRIAADIAYNRMKNTGELQRRESDRAIDEQFRWTVGV